jgi:site-specific DNA recombinase
MLHDETLLASPSSITAHAVIYARVSSQKQVTQGHGLDSQETRCRDYAKGKGYEVIAAFHEEGITGKLMDRPRMKEMLSFLRKHRKHYPNCIVIIDDISRLARDIETHIKLRTAILDAGAKLESPTLEFGEDSDSRLVEMMLATVAAHQREKNAEQVTNRMKARFMNGYWCFNHAIGYRFQTVKGHGKMLVRDEPVASIIQEALEGYASGRFESVTEVRRFLHAQPDYPKSPDGNVNFQSVTNMLERSLYAGYMDMPKWGIKLHPGKHEPLISLQTWQAIQDKMQGKAKAPARTSINEDFPLRGFVTCGCCNHPLTASWSKGRSKRYAYYYCHNKGCEAYRKNIKQDVIEGEFEVLLKELQPSATLYHAVLDMMKDLWKNRIASFKQSLGTVRREIVKIERKAAQVMDRLLQADSPVLIKAYEKEIQKLEETKLSYQEKLTKKDKAKPDFEETFRTALNFLANPWKLWASDRLEHQRMVLKMVFATNLSYVKNEGFRTAETTLPFKVLAGFQGQNNEMVEGAGFEPA